MDRKFFEELFAQTAYVRVSGTEGELRAAEYIRKACEALGAKAELVGFAVDMAQITSAHLRVDDREIRCNGYLCAGSSEIAAPLYYLRDRSRVSLSECRGKIVLFDGYLGFRMYRDLLENGAVGFISYNGDMRTADTDIDQRELRSYVANGQIMPGVNIHVSDAVMIAACEGKEAVITLEQTQSEGESHNVVVDLPGASEQTIVFTAHYDTTPLSVGAYDNMTGVAALLSMVAYFVQNPHKATLRFVFCGSEERGLLGAKAYCRDFAQSLAEIGLCINIDMIGSTMGKFIACCTSEEALVHYIRYMGCEYGFAIDAKADVYSSESTAFADCGVPAVTFARLAPHAAATIHDRYDTAASLNMDRLTADISFITSFAARMANASCLPVERVIPDDIKEKLDKYLGRKL
ncbi:MAG: M28 family peptidase [Clostridia bacterium]|nr:M28 family peptidase [Clostridia bacterium]